MELSRFDAVKIHVERHSICLIHLTIFPFKFASLEIKHNLVDPQISKWVKIFPDQKENLRSKGHTCNKRFFPQVTFGP